MRLRGELTDSGREPWPYRPRGRIHPTGGSPASRHTTGARRWPRRATDADAASLTVPLRSDFGQQWRRHKRGRRPAGDGIARHDGHDRYDLLDYWPTPVLSLAD